ncbi:unnamed protein product [Cylindrotheca closterium]|uniref:Uncharacterized protein n=1 Tax=Cylindrotheca closterium TaxID=2856 RepID=A0AAD2G453_9STRA|nr:unnamed protein product [Cylindrotheca closterium]
MGLTLETSSSVSDDVTEAPGSKTMSRWNALRPENGVEKQHLREREGKKNDESSVSYKRIVGHQRTNSTSHAKTNRTNFDERTSLIALRRLLQSYEQGLQEESFIVSEVTKTLGGYEKFFRGLPSRAADSELLLVLCKLLRINDSVVHRTLERLIESVLEDGCSLRSKIEVAMCIDALSKSCYQFPSDSSVRRSLAVIVADCGHILPAEDLAQNIVAPLLLPNLESMNSNRMLFTKTCKAISALLLNQSHKSAIIAPLVNDIAPDGTEEVVANPIRQRLFSSLERHLVGRHVGAHWRVEASCHLLTDIIDSTIKVDRSLSPDARISLRLSQTQDFFLESLHEANHPVYITATCLLRSLLRYDLQLGNGSISQPMLDLLSRILFDPEHSQARRINQCSSAKDRGYVFGKYLALVHSLWLDKSIDTEAGKATLECLAEIVSALPWDRWISGDKLAGSGPESGLCRRSTNFLLGLTNVASVVVSSCDEKSVATTACLVESYLYATKAGHYELSQFSMKLWSTVAEASLSHPSVLVRQELVSTLVKSCGGQIRPDGKTTTMYEPAQRWLMSNSSERFLDGLFIIVGRASSPSHPAIKLLSSILQGCPRIGSSDCWKRCKILFSSVDEIDASISWLVILDAVISGRRVFDDCSSSIEPIKEVVFKALSLSLNNSFVKIQCLGLSLFGSLSTNDWKQMNFGYRNISLLLSSALNLCKDGNHNVRSSGCKAIGQFCTCYIPGASITFFLTDNHLRSVVDLIRSRMSLALLDEKAQVRSMAMFTMGNLAHALRANGGGKLHASVLVDTCTTVQAAMEDSSDKVVVNSIRAAGHWGYLFARRRIEGGPQKLAHLISALVDALVASVETLSNETDSLTWKKRGAMKKYGCGVCHSLGCIFEGSVDLENESLQIACTRATKQMITCVEHFWSLSLKLTFSAMIALGKLSSNDLSRICEGSGFLGAAIATCTYQLHENDCRPIRILSTKQHHEMEVCLLHLLAAASPLDASATLEKDYFSQATLSFLYSWMVNCNVNSSTFAIFAVGLRRFQFKFVDVSLEQSFMSRSLDDGTRSEAASMHPDFDDGSEL